MLDDVRRRIVFRLDIVEPPVDGRAGENKDVGENTLFDNLAHDYKVYVLYYPNEMPNQPLEEKLRQLGRIAGKNLFVNVGQLNDPSLARVIKIFAIRAYPVIIVTAIDALATPPGTYLTAYARLDSPYLLADVDRTIECVQKVFSLFMQGEVSKAIVQSKSSERNALLASLVHLFTDALRSIGGFITDRD